MANLADGQPQSQAGLFGGQGDSVIVPGGMRSIFEQAEQTVREYFENVHADSTQGTIEIAGERYLLLRASALSVNFLEFVTQLYAERGPKEAFAVGKNLLFDLSHIIGLSDARNFHKKMNLDDPIAKLSAGPVHFSHTGWALVEILPESSPSPDENFFLSYNHPYSFEADSWLAAGKKPDSPVCIMNAGYSSGWCEASFDIELTAVEVECRAQGHDKCKFIMSPPHRIKEHLARYEKGRADQGEAERTYNIPDFFERKRSEEELQKRERTLRALINASSDLAYLTDTRGIVYEINEQAASRLGLPVEDIIGTNSFEYFPDDVAAERRKWAMRVLKEKVPLRFESRREHFIFDVSAYPILNDDKEVELIAVFIRDVTEQRNYEVKLQQARDEAEAANQAKSLFLANMSHEMRTPLNGALGFLDLALTNCDRFEKELNNGADLATLKKLLNDQRENLTIAKNSGNLLINIISDILDLAKIESGQFEKEQVQFSLFELLQNVKKEIGHFVQGKKITINLKYDHRIPKQIITDRTKIKQILLNLGNNAAKFTEQGSIEFSAMLQGQQIICSVKDTGIGIDADIHELIFQKFIQADSSTTRKYGGTGLGLALARAYTEMLGGEISLVDSAVGRGTEIAFTFDFTPGETEKNDNQIAAERPAVATVLVAEDNESLQTLLRKTLQNDYRVVQAYDGLQAVAIAKEQHIDLIIMDISMPKLSGTEALKQIREFDADIAVIAYTAHAMKEDKEELLNMGFNDYISKPVRPAKLLEKVKQLLS